MSIADDIASLASGARVELFVLDATNIGGDITRFHAGTNALGGPVKWQGEDYQPLPIEATGFEINGRGTLPRPKLRVANIGGAITALLLQFGDLRQAKVLRKRTMVKYLDAANFPGGVNPTADPSQHLQDDVYVIDRKAAENKTLVEFELAAATDLPGVMLPGRQIVSNHCRWRYKGEGCGYVPGLMFDKQGAPVTNPLLDRCSKLLATGCKPRFGANQPLPFGGFPAAGLL